MYSNGRCACEEVIGLLMTLNNKKITITKQSAQPHETVSQTAWHRPLACLIDPFIQLFNHPTTSQNHLFLSP